VQYSGHKTFFARLPESNAMCDVGGTIAPVILARFVERLAV
jgi:hypothetical protein